MRKIFALSIILFALNSSATLAVSDKYAVEDHGTNMGSVTVQQKGNLLYTDYDFGAPYDCQLESITTNQAYRTYTYTVTSSKGDTLTQYPNTYIAPRDAVLAFDISGQQYPQSQQFYARLTFNCPNGSRIATTNSYNPTHQYQHHYHNDTYSTPNPTPTSKYSYKEWFKTYSQKYLSNDSHSPAPAITPTPTKPYSYQEWLKEYSAKYL